MVWKCKNCNAENLNSECFCLYCGHENLVQNNDKNTFLIYCSACGSENDRENLFCAKCGNNLKSPYPKKENQINFNLVIIKAVLLLLAFGIAGFSIYNIVDLNLYLNDIGMLNPKAEKIESEIFSWWGGIGLSIVSLIIGLIIPVYDEKGGK